MPSSRRTVLAAGGPHAGRYARIVLREAGQLLAEPDRDPGRALSDLAQQRLQRVLGDELVRLQGQGAVVDQRTGGRQLVDRRISVMDKRWPGDGLDADEDVH